VATLNGATRRARSAAATALLLAAVSPGLAAAGAPAAEAPAARAEYEVKAAFLYNFAKFVRWPGDLSEAPRFVLAVLGDDPFGPVLDRTFAGKTILGRPVEVRRVASVADAVHAHLVFVSGSEQARLPRVLAGLADAPVLTVGDDADFADRGGMIAFRLRDDVIRFDVNLQRVERARLKMSSQLLRLAQRVIPERAGDPR
jgi:hypothetical protein